MPIIFYKISPVKFVYLAAIKFEFLISSPELRDLLKRVSIAKF